MRISSAFLVRYPLQSIIFLCNQTKYKDELNRVERKVGKTAEEKKKLDE
jgi:hypothetical protein